MNKLNSIDLTEEGDNNAKFIKFYNSIKGTCGLAWSKNNFLVKSSSIYYPLKPSVSLISLECNLNPLNPKLHCKLPFKEGLKIKKLLFNCEGNLIFGLSTLGELEIIKFDGWNSLKSIYFTDCKVNFLDFITLNSLKEFDIKLNQENITQSSSIRLPTLGFSNSIFPNCFLGVLEDGRLVIGKSSFGDQFQLHYEQLPFIPPFNHYSPCNTKLISSKLDLWLDSSVILTSIIKDSLGYKLIVAKLAIKDKLKWLGSPPIVDILLVEDNIQLAKGSIYTVPQPLTQSLTIITCHKNASKDKLQIKLNQLNLSTQQKLQKSIELGEREDLTDLVSFNYTNSEDKVLILALSNGKIQFRSFKNPMLVYSTLDVNEILKLKPTSDRNTHVCQLILSPNQALVYCTTNTNQQFTLNLIEYDFSSSDSTLTSRENRLFNLFSKSYLNRRNPLDIMKSINDLDGFNWVNNVINDLLPKNSLFEDLRINIELMEFQWTIYRYLPNHQSHSQSILLFLQYYFTLEYWLSQLEGNGLENLEQVFVIGSGNASEILRGKSINFIVDSLPSLIPHLHWVLNSFLPFYQQLDQNLTSSQLHYLLSYNHFRTIFPPLLVLAWKMISQVATNAHQNQEFQPYQKLIRSFPLSLDQLMAFLSQIVRYLNQRHPKDTTQASHWIIPSLPDWSLQSLQNLPQGLITNFSQEFKKSRGVNCEWLGLTKAFDFNFPPHLNSIELEKENLFYFELDKGLLMENNLVDWVDKVGWSINSEKFICSRCCRSSFKFNTSQAHLLTNAFEFKCICGGYWWQIPSNY